MAPCTRLHAGDDPCRDVLEIFDQFVNYRSRLQRLRRCVTKALYEGREVVEICILCDERDALLSARRRNQRIIEQRKISGRKRHASHLATSASARTLVTRAAANGAKTRRRRSNTACCTSRVSARPSERRSVGAQRLPESGASALQGRETRARPRATD